MREPQVFQPDPSKFRRELVIGAVVYVVVSIAFCLWKSLSVVWALCACVAGLPLVVGLPLLRVRLRGFDTIGLNDEGLVVSRRKGAFRVAWTEIARVYRFQDRLVFETVAPVRRHTLYLHGHEQHEDALFGAMKEYARTLDLGWLQSLASLGGLAR